MRWCEINQKSSEQRISQAPPLISSQRSMQIGLNEHRAGERRVPLLLLSHPRSIQMLMSNVLNIVLR
jgi:hypothetical protein